MPVDKLVKEERFVLVLDEFNILKKFKIKTIEDIFTKIGKLETGCFNFGEEYFSDDHYRLNFYYPTDMNENTAFEFVESILMKLRNMSLEEFNFLLSDN